MRIYRGILHPVSRKIKSNGGLNFSELLELVLFVCLFVLCFRLFNRRVPALRDKIGCVEVDGERITILLPPPPSFFFPPTIFSLNTSDSNLTSVRA